MAVMAREAWTDERLDDLTKRVDTGFKEVKGEIKEVKGEVRDLRIEISGMQRTMIVGFATIAGSTVGSVIAAALLV
ncbi:MAG TPA: hypothetical protein VN733_09675 [Solirubrobacterales bacterium]|nr:hypothetical protein [Solirubrobacterales bacterium]